MISVVALWAALSADTVKAQLTLLPARPEDPSIEWVVRDSALVPLEVGKTPATFETNIAGRVLTVCAVQPKGQIQVSLKVQGRGSALNGTSHCFRFGIEKGRVILHATFEPDKKP